MEKTIAAAYERAPKTWIMKLLLAFAAVCLLAWSSSTVVISDTAGNGLSVAGNILSGILHPDTKLLFNFTASGVAYLLLETLCIAFLGTIVGAVISVPLSFLSATNLMPKPIALLGRFAIAAIRTIPAFIYGLMFIRVTGPGPFAGLLTMSLCSIGMVSKMFIESIEDLDKRILESLDAAGCTTFQKIRYGILPQLFPDFMSTLIYRFDMNLRDATVLGLVGAGGIGAPLIFAMSSYRWNEVGSILLGLIVLVMMIEWISAKIRMKLTRGEGMEEKTLQIYFTSDLHAFIYPTDYRSAEERELGLFKCANRFQKDGNTLIIDGGDVLQGSPLGAFCHDSQEDAGSFAQIMNCCGYDYVTLGNHDFNYGMAYLDSYLDALEARCVCQNALRSDGTVRFPSRVHVLENGLRVGVVGIVTDHVNVWERPEHLTGLTITDPIPAARATLEALRGQADLTVCVYHGGFERDLATGRVLSASSENIAYRLCQELDFDILLTGHQHMCIPGQSLFGTFAVQAPDSGRAFISLKTVVADGHIVCNSQAIPAGGDCDPILLDRFGNLEQGAQTWLDTVVGRLDRPLLPAPPLIMAAEGNDIADFFNEVQMSCSGAQLAATSLANEIAGFPQTVRRRDVLTAYPYTNTLTVLRVTGSVLRRAMERSAEYFAVDEEGRLCVADAFLKPKVEHYNYDYFSGVNYAFDVSRPEGQRVVELTYQGKAVKDEDEFTICLNSYRASGAGGYPEYTQCQVVREINIEMSDLILDFFKNTPKVSLKTHRWFSVCTSPGIGAL